MRSHKKNEMDYYFEYLPNELLTEILFYINDYESFMKLYTIEIFKTLINQKNFIEKLFFMEFGDDYKILNINFDPPFKGILSTRHFILSYFRAKNLYREVLFMIREYKYPFKYQNVPLITIYTILDGAKTDIDIDPTFEKLFEDIVNNKISNPDVNFNISPIEFSIMIYFSRVGTVKLEMGIKSFTLLLLYYYFI